MSSQRTCVWLVGWFVCGLPATTRHHAWHWEFSNAPICGGRNEERKEWLNECQIPVRTTCRIEDLNFLQFRFLKDRLIKHNLDKLPIWLRNGWGQSSLSEETQPLDPNVNFRFQKIFSLAACPPANYLISLSQGFFGWKQKSFPPPQITMGTKRVFVMCAWVNKSVSLNTKESSLFKTQMLPQLYSFNVDFGLVNI